MKDVRWHKLVKDANEYEGGLMRGCHLIKSALFSPEQDEVLDLIEFCNKGQ